MSKDDPYHDNKVYHKASLFSQCGAVSAICFARPRPINLDRSLWTIVDESVTCKKCLKILAERKKK